MTVSVVRHGARGVEIARLEPSAATARVHREPDSKVTMRADHATALRHVAEEAARIAAAATKVVQMCTELMATTGGTLSIQPQVNFLTGAQARLLKDWAVCEHLQQRGMSLRRPARDR